MTTDRMIELLEIEHECMLRGSHDDCDRNCADCELVQDDDELHEMYTNVIALLKEQEAKCCITDMGAYCPSCGKDLYLDDNPHFCGVCGQAVKWD